MNMERFLLGGKYMNIKIMTFKSIEYIIRYPNEYVEGKKYPIIFLLHGAGGRGNNIKLLKDNPFFKITEKHKEFPFITIAPQCSENTWFDMFELLKMLVFEVVSQPFADKNRIYLIGASMGGYGTWQLAMSMPEKFAAIVPICGGGMYWNAGRLIDLPIWAFHGENDSVVNKEESIKMVEAVNKSGGNAKLTIYPETQHDAWSKTYANWKVFEWLLDNTNKNITELKDAFNDSNLYG